MAGKTVTPDTTLVLKRTYQAKREKVFRAWTDPQALTKWFAPTDDSSTPLAQVDLRVGGSYRIQMKTPDGRPHTVHGVFREIKEPERLVFTWQWEESWACGVGETLVTVELHERPDGTELVLTQEGFVDAAERDRHIGGWTGCLSRLPKGL